MLEIIVWEFIALTVDLCSCAVVGRRLHVSACQARVGCYRGRMSTVFCLVV